MKKSKAVPLLMLGTLVLAGCGPSYDDDATEIRQSSYRSIEDCQKDWGDDSRDCKRHPNGAGYIGPRYIWNRNSGYPMAIMPNGDTRPLSNSYIARGGSSAAFATSSSSVSRGGGFNGGRAAGSSVSHGGFGSSAHASSAGG